MCALGVPVPAVGSLVLCYAVLCCGALYGVFGVFGVAGDENAAEEESDEAEQGPGLQALYQGDINVRAVPLITCSLLVKARVMAAMPVDVLEV